MKKRIEDVLQNRMRNDYMDISYENFIEMKEAGLSDGEIANELGISKCLVKEVKKDLTKEY